MVSAYLDPRYCEMLNDEQKKKAIEFIKDQMKNENIQQEIQDEQKDLEKSQFELYLQSLKQKGKTKINPIFSHIEKQINSWELFISQNQVNLTTDSLDFWENDSSIKNYFDLKKLALNILCTPASTSSVERIFSAANNACIGRRNRLSDKRLEMIVFFKNNSKYLNSINFFK